MLLFLLLVAVPIIEIWLFLEIGGLIGTWPTIAIVVLTALVGSMMLRHQGLSAMRDVQSRLSSGENPGRLLADGAMILFAGALLLTPGFFTDAVGFLLLIPPVRTLVWNYAAARVKVREVRYGMKMHAGVRDPGGFGPRGAGGQTVDGTYEDVTPEDIKPGDDDAPTPPVRR